MDLFQVTRNAGGGSLYDRSSKSDEKEKKERMMAILDKAMSILDEYEEVEQEQGEPATRFLSRQMGRQEEMVSCTYKERQERRDYSH